MKFVVVIARQGQAGRLKEALAQAGYEAQVLNGEGGATLLVRIAEGQTEAAMRAIASAAPAAASFVMDVERYERAS